MIEYIIAIFWWPIKWWRLLRDRCPYCNRRFIRVSLEGRGPLTHRRSEVWCCTHYHFFASESQFGDGESKHIELMDRRGRLPEEAIQIIDALYYGMYRVLLHGHLLDGDDLAYHQNKAMDAAVRSCEPLMDKLLNL